MPEMSLLPVPNQQFLDNNGDPLSGGKLYFYEPGTTTNKTVYSDSDGLTSLSNPVILDSAGRVSIWLNGYYKIKVDDANDVNIYTVDNISSQYYQVTSNIQWTLQNDTLTYVNGTQFSLSGDATATYEIGRRLKAVVSTGTIYGTVMASSAAGAPVETTVTVLWDSGALDSGLSTISVGILTISNPSVPPLTTQSKNANYTLALTDFDKTITMSSNGTALTLLAASAVPNGFKFDFLNTGANQMTLTGTVNGFANTTFLQYEGAGLFSDGSNWFSKNLHNQDAIGTIKDWHKSFTGTPQILPWGWVECSGQTISDAESVYNDQAIPNINGDGHFIRGSNTSGNEQANQNLEHAHASGSFQLANGNVTGSSFIREQIGGSFTDAIAGCANANGSLSGVAIQNLSAGSANDYLWCSPASAGGGGLRVSQGISGSTANSGNAESRPDNISMVKIMKIK